MFDILAKWLADKNGIWLKLADKLVERYKII